MFITLKVFRDLGVAFIRPSAKQNSKNEYTNGLSFY